MKKTEKKPKTEFQNRRGYTIFMSYLVVVSEIFKLIYLIKTWVLICPFQIFLSATLKLNFIKLQIIVYLAWVEIIYIKT